MTGFNSGDYNFKQEWDSTICKLPALVKIESKPDLKKLLTNQEKEKDSESMYPPLRSFMHA